MQSTGLPPSRPAPSTITCPTCRVVLKVTQPDTTGGPCPACGYPIELIPVLIRPRHLAKDKPGIQPRHTPAYQEAPPEPPPHHPSLREKTLHSLGKGYDFLNTRNGQAVGGLTVGIMFLLCVFLFFKWDIKHRRTIPPSQPASTEQTPAAGASASEPTEYSQMAGLDLPVAPLR